MQQYLYHKKGGTLIYVCQRSVLVRNIFKKRILQFQKLVLILLEQDLLN